MQKTFGTVHHTTGYLGFASLTQMPSALRKPRDPLGERASKRDD